MTLILLLGVAPAASAGPWSSEETIFRGKAYAPTIAGNTPGDAMVAWTTHRSLVAAVRPAGGRFEAPIRLATHKAGGFTIFGAGMDEGGNGFVGFIDDRARSGPPGLIRVAIVRLDGRVRVETVSTRGEIASAPRLAVGQSGRALVLWTVAADALSAGDFLVQARGDARGFDRPRVIDSVHNFYGLTGLTGVDSRGRPMLLQTYVRRGREFLLGRDGTSAGRWRPRYKVASAVMPKGYPEYNALAFALDGSAGGIATWVGFPVQQPTCCESDTSLYTLIWRHGGEAIDAQRLAVSDLTYAPSLAAAPGGRALVAWIARDVIGPAGSTIAPVGVQLAERKPGGEFKLTSGLVAYPPCCDGTPSISLAVNDRGSAVLAWEGRSGRAAIRNPDGTFEPTRAFRHNLAPIDRGYGSMPNQTATIDGHGRATVLLSGPGVYVAGYTPRG